MNTIEDRWETYKKQAVSPEATEEQIAYLRQTFFVGASSVLEIQDGLMDGSVSENAAWGVVVGLFDEVASFIKGL